MSNPNPWVSQVPNNYFKYGTYGEPGKFYVSPNGLDNPNVTGSINDPFRSVLYAVTRVGAGDIIHLLPGIYVEDTQIEVPAGVTIEGENELTVITSTNNAVGFRILNLESADEGSPGNQEIRNIWFDGGALTVYWCIYVIRRSNVKIHHCNFVDFLQTAVLFKGSAGAGEAGTYSEDNEFSDNIVDNCAQYTGGTGYGALRSGSQRRFKVLRNWIRQTGRGAGNNGYCYKYQDNGFEEEYLFEGNYFERERHNVPYNIAVEFHNTKGGIIFRNNTVVGSCLNIAGARNERRTYQYTALITNNHFYYNTLNAADYLAANIIIEGESTDIYVTRNFCQNANSAIMLTAYTAGTTFERVYVYYNIIHNFGNTADNLGAGMTIGGGSAGSFMQNVHIFNNVICDNDADTRYGIWVHPMNSVAFDNLFIMNNIFIGAVLINCYTQSGGGAPTITNFAFLNNLSFSCGNANDPFYGIVPANLFDENHVKADPLFIDPVNGNYHLGAGSPAEDAGMNLSFMEKYRDYDNIEVDNPPCIGAFEI